MMNIIKDYSRDSLLTDFGKATLSDRYLNEGESYQDLFARVAWYYRNNDAHAQRLYDYISQHWFMPATPVLSNGGTQRGLPISCFLNEAQDSMDSIANTWHENVHLAKSGGGIGTYWGNVRSIGEEIEGKGKTSGVIPFIKVSDSATIAVSQGSLRRGSAAAYMPVHHPEIEEFVDVRRPTGGDPNRRSLNIHHGVMVDDEFMMAVESGSEYDLKSPVDGHVVKTIKARDLWIRILTARLEMGEPYIIFSDTVKRSKPNVYKRLGLNVKTSNLCAEITLATGIDFNGEERTAVCCLSSLNLEYYNEWKDDPQFFYDVMLFLDNVLQDFIDRAPDDMSQARYSAMRERSVGLGVMGFHSFLQSIGVPFEGVMAKVWNGKIFKNIYDHVVVANGQLGRERGSAPDVIESGQSIPQRFSHATAIAPTASISIIAGGTSPGIDPVEANVFLQKTLSGSFKVKNKHLQKILAGYGKDTDAVWSSITTNKGSVQHLDFLSQDEKDIYKTALEIDQRWVISHTADRQPFVDQSQSMNIWLPGDIHKRDLHDIHFSAWKRGVKSMYYCRSASKRRSESVSGGVEKDNVKPRTEPDECLACQ